MPTNIYDNKYHYQKDLGTGGFGRVFLAKEEVSGKPVAIKELNSGQGVAQDSIIREIKAISAFYRPHIVAYHTNFSQNGKLYLVMEYCAQGDLWNAYKAEKLSGQEILSYLKTVADEMAYLHGQGIIHRDIKPKNLLLSEDRTVKITDFGIANTLGGTMAYLSPEAFSVHRDTRNDPRVDIYALGVTMMELLTGFNPFLYLNQSQIYAVHNRGDFPINRLPAWQQNIILKAIKKEPELRFQTMAEFSEALEAGHVPMVVNRAMIRSGDISSRVEKQLRRKQWRKAIGMLDHAESQYPESVQILKLKGDYYLRTGRISDARHYYEKAQKLNPRLDIQKELGSILLVQRHYSKAISLLSDHLYRSPGDLEAYNLLLQCYYETGRYEAGMDLAETLLGEYKNHPCFVNNHFVCNVLMGGGQNTVRKVPEPKKENPFLEYNTNVCNEPESCLSHNFMQKPTIKSKLLFMDYRFHKLETHFLQEVDRKHVDAPVGWWEHFIITIKREGYSSYDHENEIDLVSGNQVSRRHCVIINSKNDVWLVDLESTGVFVNGHKVHGRMQLIGRNSIQMGQSELTITTDRKKLL